MKNTSTHITTYKAAHIVSGVKTQAYNISDLPVVVSVLWLWQLTGAGAR
jgi:hypothetical protein